MTKFLDIKHFIIIWFCLITLNLKAYDNYFCNVEKEYQDIEVPAKVFSDLENAISSGNVTTIAKYFSGQNFLSLSTGISGYYSANQSFYVLQDFFNIHSPITFKFTTLKGGRNAYATGTLVYKSHNIKKTALVFISLESTDNNWKISQITIK
jgi:hypothetical protein